MASLFNSSPDEVENKFDIYGNMIYKICLVILCNQYDAEDALQKTFLRYMEKHFFMIMNMKKLGLLLCQPIYVKI
jgi:DNA-directed RNA polymerase specialized sigma24 family protein